MWSVFIIEVLFKRTLVRYSVVDLATIIRWYLDNYIKPNFPSRSLRRRRRCCANVVRTTAHWAATSNMAATCRAPGQHVPTRTSTNEPPWAPLWLHPSCSNIHNQHNIRTSTLIFPRVSGDVLIVSSQPFTNSYWWKTAKKFLSIFSNWLQVYKLLA